VDSRGSSPTRRSEADESRLEALLNEYGAILKRAIASFSPGRLGIQVDDVEQEARIRVWKVLEREKEIEDPASYLYRVAVSATIDAVRRVRARREEQPAEPDARGESRAAPVDPSPSPEQRAEANEITAAVQRASSRLAEDRRSAVLLLLQGLNSGEIARVLGWTEGRARNLAYRGLADLRQELAAEGVTLGH
jgi:RNA polymerase sigma factor (sigma-70 family)